MQLGEIQTGIIRTMRYFRGSSIIQNRLGQVGVEIQPKGGISALFEIDYNSGIVKAAVAVARADDKFSKAEGRKYCQEKFDAGKVIEFKNDENFSLFENLYGHLVKAWEDKKVTQFERTLLDRLDLYIDMNEGSAALFEDIVPATH